MFQCISSFPLDFVDFDLKFREERLYFLHMLYCNYYVRITQVTGIVVPISYNGFDNPHGGVGHAHELTINLDVSPSQSPPGVAVAPLSLA